MLTLLYLSRVLQVNFSTQADPKLTRHFIRKCAVCACIKHISFMLTKTEIYSYKQSRIIMTLCAAMKSLDILNSSVSCR